ncbi:putative spore protein YtfJ [Lentibacillus sp. JNUCC-1]|uniref:GerW family sporulation protein n=1 Tax=Lentibacillus sp. JNUCC-1 TaxID=2654513 RepID=UPI0012E72998|nr:GerW family sporulation protein [Lentibacillus sp. JNUCC-1]MUV39316.1 putative spore protein YtfJ [Lentibacillus sp. JNUCC-1]
MDTHPIQSLMTTAMENLKEMVEVNTIIGDPIESSDGSMIIPISKAGFGFAAGGSDYLPQGSETSGGGELAFGGGSGGGVSITPIAFLVIKNKDVQMIHIDQQTHIYEKLLELAPQAADKIEKMIQNFSKSSSNQESSSSNQDEKKQQHYDI